MAIIGDEDGGFARIAISRSFPNLLYRLFADLQMPADFQNLFQPCSSLGIISTAKFFLIATRLKLSFRFHIYISFFRMYLCSAVWLLLQNPPWQKWVKDAKIRHNQPYLLLKMYSKIFLLPKEKWNNFLRIVSGIIRQYNLHSLEFVIKAE